MGYKYISLNLNLIVCLILYDILKDCLPTGVGYYNSRRFHEQTIP